MILGCDLAGDVVDVVDLKFHERDVLMIHVLCIVWGHFSGDCIESGCICVDVLAGDVLWLVRDVLWLVRDVLWPVVS